MGFYRFTDTKRSRRGGRNAAARKLGRLDAHGWCLLGSDPRVILTSTYNRTRNGKVEHRELRLWFGLEEAEQLLRDLGAAIERARVQELSTKGRRTVVHQDGASFYTDSGALVWCAPTRVPDGDVHAAKVARALFVDWAKRSGLRIEWEE